MTVTAGPPIHDTIDALSAEELKWPVIVIGAGIAGTCVAASLASKGVQVLLVDKGRPPRNKTCGCCMNLRAVRGLDRLGLLETVSALAPRAIDGMILLRGEAKAAIPFPKQGALSPIAVSRIALDRALLAAAISRGAHFLGDTRVISSRLEGDHRVVRVRASDGYSAVLKAGIVVACDGLGSGLARGAELDLPHLENAKVGASAIFEPNAFDLPSGKIIMATGDSGYVGVVQLEDARWNVAAALHADALKEGISHMIARLLDECRISHPDISATKWTTCPKLGREVIRPWTDRMLLAGDSSGYIEPITGEGMAWAVAAAESAAAVACEPWSDSSGKEYGRAWTRRVATSRKAVRSASALLDRGWMATGAIRTLGAIPSAGKALGESLNQDPR